MPVNIYIFIEHSVPFILIAAFGGLVGFLNKKEQRSVWQFLADITTGSFIGGVVIHSMICESPVPLGIKVAVIGIGGILGGDLIPLLERILSKFLERRLK